MSVKIRLKRMGAKKRPYYRIVVMDSASPRDGRSIEELGYYHPVEKQDQVKINEDGFRDWVSKGAIPSDTVKRLLNKNRFKAES
ncbi:30S ribosomal protein S16 [Borrelia sp. RT1S]|uniref:30S ribosomal protein S16 n=1 Tax=Borrelia sp. RT1S TaxID=2898580 RepID=UPI001E3E8FB7|nr:30S ribosomal protein S16 [Borrelia sp. RT1S]UGQ17470.1 30S ribosomal protein S16 [Borrelia sp. RT1S]